MALPEWAETRLRQSGILLKKNWILSKRSLRSTVVQILVPFFFVFLLFIFQIALNSRATDEYFTNVTEGDVESYSKIPRCILGPGLDACNTIAYTANNMTAAAEVINIIKSRNDIPDSEIISFPSLTDMNNYFSNNPNKTQGGYSFDLNVTSVLTYTNPACQVPGCPNVTALVDTFKYAVHYNQTEIVTRGVVANPAQEVYLPMQYAAELALADYIRQGSPTDIKLDRAVFPHPALFSRDVVGESGPTFFFGALMFNFVIQLGAIVAEKENKLREGMNTMGLKDSVYWFTWFLTNFIMNTLSVTVLIISGLIFQFDFFLKNDFGLYFFTFFLFGVSMVALVFFLSTLVTRARTATSLGFVVFLIGIIIQGFAGLAFDEDFDAFWRFVFSLLPFVLLAKGINELSTAISNDGDGMRWSERTDNAFFSMDDVYGWLVLDFVIYFFLAWYLDNVLPGQYGTAKKPWFFLTMEYWRGRPSAASAEKKAQQAEEMRKKAGQEMDSGLEDDVLAEAQAVQSGNIPDSSAVIVRNLIKRYRRYTLGVIPDKESDFLAVKGTNFFIDAGSLFCLLGHNGAGKTTTINMLTGLFAPTAGEAEILGHSIVNEMHEIRRQMGVCPQHDILWDQMTSGEHLEMFAAFKGLKGEALEQEIVDRLEDVGLTYVRDVPAGAYSGGMKRRLSTAIAFTAEPNIVFLDEPTTGMDPVSRRAVWELIQKKKKGRVIILTTHSMEEADILGDKIVIMSHGKLKCTGTSLHLKNKYGAGYVLRALFNPSCRDDIVNFVRTNNVLKLEVGEEVEGQADFGISRDDFDKLPEFFSLIENKMDELGITDIQLSMTTLEEVFLRVAGLVDEE